MLALSIAGLLFLYFTWVGLGVMRLARFPCDIFRQWMLAPALGLSTLTVLIATFHQAGLPVSRFGVALAIALLALSSFAFVRSKPVFPWRQIAPFLGVLFFALLYIGWPAIQFGLHWISFGNDDMANYCLSAERSLNNGFSHVPTPAELGGKDYSQYLWFLVAEHPNRFGSDILLAWVSSVTGITPLKIFMPTILALGLVQLTSLAALLATSSRNRKLALISTALLAIGPLFAFGVYYQLIAQVAGLALLLAAFAVLSKTGALRDRASYLRYSFVSGILCAATALVYPEITPFGVLALVLFWGVRILTFKSPPSRIAYPLLLTGVFSVILLRENVAMYFHTLILQTSGGLQASKYGFLVSVFPYFLTPTGLPNLFGMQAIAAPLPEPYFAITLALSVLALAGICVAAVRLSLKAEPFACLLLVMTGMTFLLFAQGNGFGTFKMAMYLQPALMAGIASCIPRSRIARALGVAAYLGLTLLPHAIYLHASMGTGKGGSFSEMPKASSMGIEAPKVLPGERVLCASNNVVACKILGLLLRENELACPATNWGSAFCHAKLVSEYLLPISSVDKSLSESVFSRGKLWDSEFIISRMDVDTPQPYSRLIVGPAALSPINQLRAALLEPPDEKSHYFASYPYDRVKNWLIFVVSTRGVDYYRVQKGPISLFKQELDVMAPARRFAGLGRFLLFRVVNPTKQVRLRISMTDSIMGGGRTQLPMEARVLGENEARLPFIGGGAACVLSEPVTPILYKGEYYIALDMGRDGLFFPSHISGTMALFRREFTGDSRQLVGFLRDVSVVSEDECNSLEKPKALRKFPADLLSPTGLTFSGIYEDGWISDHALLTLGGAKQGSSIVIQGTVPGIGKLATEPNELRVWITGQPMQKFSLHAGAFEVKLPILGSLKETELHLEFEKFVSLTSPDDRPASAQIQSISIEEPVP